MHKKLCKKFKNNNFTQGVKDVRSEKEISELLNKYLKDAYDILDSLDIKYEPIDEIYAFENDHDRGHAIKRDNHYRIRINSRLLESDIPYNEVMNTVIHELLHCHKDRMCHTGEWKRCANLVNENYKQFNIQTRSSGKILKLDNPKYKYHVICKDCDEVMFYQRKSKCIKDLLLKRKKWFCCECYSDNLEVKIINN